MFGTSVYLSLKYLTDTFNSNSKSETFTSSNFKIEMRTQTLKRTEQISAFLSQFINNNEWWCHRRMSICAARTMNGSPTLDETCGKHFIDSKIDAGNPEEFRQQNLCDLLENSKTTHPRNIIILFTRTTRLRYYVSDEIFNSMRDCNAYKCAKYIIFKNLK